jgi:hypothetical protein
MLWEQGTIDGLVKLAGIFLITYGIATVLLAIPFLGKDEEAVA